MDKEPRLLGVIGHPIQHSLSPDMHNAVFKKLNLNCSYSAYDVTSEKLESFLEECIEKRFGGLNVTTPHKVDVIKYLDSVDENARRINAVNTIKFNEKIKIGYNTDGVGCINALREEGEKIKGKRILVLGAGGAARAITFQCALEGAEIIISNRTRENAINLSKEIREKLGRRVLVVNYSEKSIKDIMPQTDILINTTTVGMHPKANRSPITADTLRKEVTVMDIVYNPVETLLLKTAKRKGCKTIDGVGMLAHQGAESLKIWLNLKAPVDEMKKTVLEKLKAR